MACEKLVVGNDIEKFEEYKNKKAIEAANNKSKVKKSTGKRSSRKKNVDSINQKEEKVNDSGLSGYV